MRRSAILLSLFASAAMAAEGPAAAKPGLAVPMERKLVSVKLIFGEPRTKETSVWEGSYRVTAGRIVATDGWRFVAGDYATLSEFKCENRRFYPRFWQKRGRDAKTLPIEPNGFILTLADLTPKSVLEVKTGQGDFTVPVGGLGYGNPRRTSDRQVEYQRVPTARHVVRAATEDGYPSAVAGPQGQLYVSYIAFTHGEGFRVRPGIKEAPKDFSFLAKPTGGDQLMFAEMGGGEWAAPAALTEPGGDLLGTAMVSDGQGRLWVFWAANVDENWDLYAKVRTGAKWSDVIRITSAPGSDFHPVAAADAEGRVWLAWQHLGQESSDVMAARQQGSGFGRPMPVAATAANEWSPAIAASSDGQVAVAWDTYGRGSYDLHAKVWKAGAWDAERTIAATLNNECRPSVAFDTQNRLWIAYEVSPEGWGKDYGPYDRSPKRVPLYNRREVGLRVLAGSTLYQPKADVNLGMPVPDGRHRWPKAAKRFRTAGPKLAVGADGRIWLTGRVRIVRFDSMIGGTWVSFLTTLDAAGWRSASVVLGTDGFLHESPAMVPAPGSGLYMVSASDGRFRTAALFGPKPWKRRQRPKAAPDANTRGYVVYPDWQFNKEISVADTGPVRSPNGPPELVEVEEDKPQGPSPEALAEAKQVAAIRSYEATVRGRRLHIVRGEFHRHTEISSDGAGDGSLFDMWRYGIDMAALDWIGNGDHDNGGGREFSWWFTQKTTSLFTMPGLFTPMYTYERSCNYPDGHRNAVFARRGIRALGRLRGGKGKAMDDLPEAQARPHTPDTQMFYAYLRHFDGICASHTSGTDMGTDWRDNDPKVEPIVEIYQGDRQNYERPDAPRSNTAQYSIGGWRPLGFVSRALMMGYRLGFQSSSDHISTHMSYCNVFVEEPTREAIFDGMKRRRVYGSTDNIIADVRCGEHFMGEEFTVGEPPTLRVKLIGTAAFAEVVIVKDNQYVYSAQPNTAVVEFDWTDKKAQPGRTSYYYVRGTQVGQTQKRKVRAPSGERVELDLNNGEVVWVSPMWITYKP